MSKKELTKEEKIEQEYKKILNIFKDKDSDFLKLNDELFKRVAFMEITLKDMEKIINEEGAVIEAVNGNGFKVYSEHPAQKSYNTMMKNYSGAMSKLNGFMETSVKANDGDEFDEF